MKKIVFKPNGLNRGLFVTMWKLNQEWWLRDDPTPDIKNLCQWMRVVIFWPIFHFVALVAVAFALFSALAYCVSELADPVTRVNFWKISAQMFVGTVAIVLAFVLWDCLVKKAKNVNKKHPARVKKQKVTETLAEISIFGLVWTYGVALKQKVCPVIYVEGEDNESV